MKVAVCAPASTVTVGGTVPAVDGVTAVATTVPPAGAGRSRPTVNTCMPPGAMVAVPGVSDTSVGCSVPSRARTVAVNDATGATASCAVSVAVPAAVEVTGTVTLVAPIGTVTTSPGTRTAALFDEVIATAVSAGAAWLSDTVSMVGKVGTAVVFTVVKVVAGVRPPTSSIAGPRSAAERISTLLAMLRNARMPVTEPYCVPTVGSGAVRNKKSSITTEPPPACMTVNSLNAASTVVTDTAEPMRMSTLSRAAARGPLVAISAVVTAIGAGGASTAALVTVTATMASSSSWPLNSATEASIDTRLPTWVPVRNGDDAPVNTNRPEKSAVV